LERAAHRNVEPIRVAVKASAFPRMVRKHVRRLEFEGFPDDHDRVTFCKRAGRSGFRTPVLPGTLRNFIGTAFR
jgi:hypothetical protein